MIREIRLLLYFFVGFLLSAVSVLSYAETIPATSSGQSVQQYQCGAISSPWVTTQDLQVACAAAGGQVYVGGTCYSDYAHGVSLNGAPNNCRGRNEVEYSCPSGQNWTLTGSDCTRPDCLSPEVRLPSGLCGSPCVVGASSTAARYVGNSCTLDEASCLGTRTAVPATLCDGQCVGNVQTADSCHGDVSKKSGNYYPVVCEYTVLATGAICSGGNGAAPDVPASDCSSRGMCGGTVNNQLVCFACDSSSKQITTTTNTPSSGPASTTTSTTTQTCTGAGSCSSTTTVSNSTGTTTTNVAGGPSGNGKGTATSDGQGNYKLDLPTDYQRDATGNETNKLLGEIKDKFTPDTSDDSPLSGATHSAASQTELDEKNNLFTQAATGATDPTSGNKSAWSAAMSSGWWEPITLAGCAPIQSSFSGKTWNLDPCPTAAKISEIGAYAMWVALVIGGFVMLTGGRVQS